MPEEIWTCSREIITCTCTLLQETVHRWKINPSIPDVQHTFFELDHTGDTIATVNNRGHHFNFTLISRSPLTSTMTTIAGLNLDGVTVSCEDRNTNTVATSPINIIQNGSHYNSISCYLYMYPHMQFRPASRNDYGKCINRIRN